MGEYSGVFSDETMIESGSISLSLSNNDRNEIWGNFPVLVDSSVQLLPVEEQQYQHHQPNTLTYQHLLPSNNQQPSFPSSSFPTSTSNGFLATSSNRSTMNFNNNSINGFNGANQINDHFVPNHSSDNFEQMPVNSSMQKHTFDAPLYVQPASYTSPYSTGRIQVRKEPVVTSTRHKANESKKKTSRKRKKRSGDEPQKPVSAYALFFRDTQASIKADNPTASFGSISKIVATMWDSLSDSRKLVYKQKTETAKRDYLKLLAAYRANLVSKGCLDIDSDHSKQVSQPQNTQQQASQVFHDGHNYSQMVLNNQLPFEQNYPSFANNSTNETCVFQSSPTSQCNTYNNHMQTTTHNYQPSNQQSQFSWLLTSTGPQASPGFTGSETEPPYTQQVISNQQFHENSLPPLIINQQLQMPNQQQQQQPPPQQQTVLPQLENRIYSYNENCFENLP